MTNLKEFIEEFRLRCTFAWDDAMEAWFESVGQMEVREIDIPAEYKYESKGYPLDSESPWHEEFKNASDEVIVEIAKFCFRYLALLQRNGCKPDYE